MLLLLSSPPSSCSRPLLNVLYELILPARFLPFFQHSEVMWWAWRSLKGSRNGSWWHAARVRESDSTAQRTFEFELHRSFSGDRVSAIFRESR